MRPSTLDEIVGQQALLGPGTPLRRAIEADELRSLILWGPPGCGKTTLARVIAGRTRATFLPFSAVLSGIKEVREIMQQAAAAKRATGRRTIVFIDEIHRFNKAQQDAFLPFVEDGTIVLIGATTENPSFEVNAALLSRSRVCRLERLSEEDLVALARRALADRERGLGAARVTIDDGVLEALAAQSQGDARAVLNGLEFAVATAPEGRLTLEHLRQALQKAALYHDRAGEEHFNLISALHKSMRNSDADATMYWLARMLEAGDDPLYVARRIVRFASEDIGLADPRALDMALAAKEAVAFVGRPEADLALAQAAVYGALAPKSNALYAGWKDVLETIREGATDPVPMSIRNAVTGLMKSEGYGSGYEYAHDHEDAVTALECLPERLRGRRFYRPTSRGLEAELATRIDAWIEARERLKRRD
ncbi:MAG TPA: replication-associated recombination protein A [Candidatus Polarisedimenticolaceae bacterium]|nr:replication-associated recombination protein A [Candidatus Polarisedimenticolaceae bacterium]